MAEIRSGPVDRVAVVSDVHGNAVAFEAVLAEALSEQPDMLVNLGCLTYGPQPSLVADMLSRVPIPVLSVRGNGDRAVLELVDGTREIAGERDRFAITNHDEAAIAMLRDTAPTHHLDVYGLGSVIFCHGSPRSDTELITPVTPIARLRDVITNQGCDVLATGHTHLQFDRPVDVVRSVGPGSVGLPYHNGPPGARWAMIGPDIHLRVTSYDVAAAAVAAMAADFPDADQWAQMLFQPPTTDQVIADAEARIFSD